MVICRHALTLRSQRPDNSPVTRAATAIGEYPHPLAYLWNGIVSQAVCGFRQARHGLCHSGSTLRYPAGHRYTAFVIAIWREAGAIRPVSRATGDGGVRARRVATL